jgi:hypothetical protein
MNTGLPAPDFPVLGLGGAALTPRPPRLSHVPLLVRLALAAAVAAAGCSRGPEGSTENSSYAPPPLRSPLSAMEAVEDLSEAVANRLIEFSDAIRKRDYPSARRYLAADFLGSAFAERPAAKVETLPLGVQRTAHRVEAGAETGIDAEGFLRSLETLLAPLEAIELVFFKTRGAEFEADQSRGLLRMTANVIGRAEGGAPFSLASTAQAEVVRREGVWLLRRFILEKLEASRRATPIFTEVAAEAGVAHSGPRIGTPENSNFYWRGAASADVDGDGRFDIFASTGQRNFLYRNRGDGIFEDITEAAGLLRPAGVTGPLFLDFDRDGDQDLFCGHVGWLVDGVPQGEPLHLYANDGSGRFREVTAEVGLGGHYHDAFSACAADVDNDGWLDIYVANYNRLDAVYPNSWFRATNGRPNALFRSLRGAGFKETAADSGVAGSDWSYAAAFADFDDDGDQDLFVANDYGDKRLYRNRGDGTFEDRTEAAGVLDTGNGMGAAWGDLDNDGRLDLYASNMASSAGNRILNRLVGSSSAGGSASKSPPASIGRTLLKLAAGNSIFLGRGEGFELLPPASGGIGASWAWSPSLLDIDLDGRLDIYVANGFISGDSLKDT